MSQPVTFFSSTDVLNQNTGLYTRAVRKLLRPLLLIPWKIDKPLKIYQKINKEKFYLCKNFLAHDIIRSRLVS